MNLRLDLPDVDDPDALRKAERAAREAAVLELYSAHAISAGRAVGELGLPLVEFLKLASGRGIAVLDLSPEELESDFRNADPTGSPGH